MTTIVEAVVTDDALTNWPKYFGGLIVGPWDPTIKFFRIGEGGWEDPGTTVRQRRTPDPTLTDLDCNVNPGRYPADSLYDFQKSFSPGDIVEESPGVIRATCFLDTFEANNDGLGNSPEFWEIALFSDAPGGGNMAVAYGTMQKQTKVAGSPLTVVVRVSFAR